jgi:hypothetical protein
MFSIFRVELGGFPAGGEWQTWAVRMRQQRHHQHLHHHHFIIIIAITSIKK